VASLLVITGPPGAGKSTVASLVAQRSNPSVLIDGDAFFAFLDQGAIPPWLPQSHAQNDVVVRAAAAATGRFATTFTTVYDGVIGPWFLPTFAAETGLPVLDYVVLLPTVDDCLERVRTRQGHGFNDEPATRKMHDEFSRAPIEARHVLRNLPTTPGEVAQEVLMKADAGTLAYQA
jgi:predicted ABC-type ATPase